MNYSTLKEIYNKAPYTIKNMFSNILRNKIIHHPGFVETYDKLEQMESWNQEQMVQEQFRRLKETIIYAYEHTKYYRNLFDSISLNPYTFNSLEDFQKIPILTKKILKERFSDLIVDECPGYLVTTGGTTGDTIEVMMSNDAYYIEWAFVYHFWSKFGYNMKYSKIATFRGLKLGKKIYDIIPMYREIRMNIFAMNRNNIKEYLKAIKKYNAEFIYGYPSAIYNFCKLVQELDLPVDGMFQAALLISENLYPFQRKQIQEVLNCPIAIFYGHSERAVFAEHYDAGYTFNPLYGLAEIDERKELIVTGFINKKMPLIRYQLDDQAIKNDFTSHKTEEVITEKKRISNPPMNKRTQTKKKTELIRPGNYYTIQGHRDVEVLYGRNGEEISSAALNFHDDTFQYVLEHQFKQNKNGTCILCIVTSHKLTNREVNNIKRSVNQKLGPALYCDVQEVDQIEMTSKGKYRYIVHEKNDSKMEND